MTHKFKVPFEWVHFHEDATEMLGGSDWEAIGCLARKLLDEAVMEQFAEYDVTAFGIDGTDETHIEIIIDDPNKAMLFKLTNP